MSVRANLKARRRARGAAAVEYLIVLTFIAVAGLLLATNLGRTVRCKMSGSSACSGSDNVQLKPADDGCIGLVCSAP